MILNTFFAEQYFTLAAFLWRDNNVFAYNTFQTFDMLCANADIFAVQSYCGFFNV